LPKGPSLVPGEKRLAVEVEDHPLEYGEFEGAIPKDEYGGGTVLLWDRGYWKLRGRATRDKLDFDLYGEKLQGHWTLVRTRGKRTTHRRRDNNWLLIKRSDPRRRKLQPDDRSVASGRTISEIARDEDTGDGGDQQAIPDPGAVNKARKAEMPDFVPPQLATLVSQAPAGDGWVHEIKFDGYRLMARIDNGKLQLLTRNGKDWSGRFPRLSSELLKLPIERALIDGEIASFEQDGSTSFRKLQDSFGSSKRPSRTDQLVFQTFDLLYLNEHDLRPAPLLARKQVLFDLLRTRPEMADRVRYSDHIVGHGPDFFAQACEMGLEGIISKLTDAGYRSGRHRSWLKTKCTNQDEFVVGGYSRPAGARSGFGALLLGAWSDDGLVYAGRVGSGFSERQLADIHRRLKAAHRKTSPFAEEVPDQADVRWVTPELVVDVEFTERTGSGALRHPVFRGLREDKDPKEVRMKTDVMQAETSAGPAKPQVKKPRTTTIRPRKTRSGSEMSVAGVRLTNPERVMFPEQGVTKLDLARYYEEIEDWILPHLANRPLSLLRCPAGRGQECFFQKHPGQTFAKHVPRVPIREKKGGTSEFVYVTSSSEIVALVQFGVLEFHPWGSLVSDVEAPDTLIFDLDPGPDVTWRAIVEATTSLHERITTLGLHGFLQATGGKGLHIVVPIKPKISWDEAKAFAQALARAHAQDDPGKLTINMAKSKREGKVFLDYLRNGRGSTSIARYSSRARPGAPVATPLRWDELSPAANANRYTITNLRRRLGALKADPWADYEQARTAITAGMRKKLGLA
ncbi:MAG: DNA ligase D, partial [Wenzhouxiangella sp.]